MAKKVAELPASVGQGPSKYPWDDWLDGDPWELVPGEDFEISVDNFRSACYAAAEHRGLKVAVRFIKRDNLLYLQARKHELSVK